MRHASKVLGRLIVTTMFLFGSTHALGHGAVSSEPTSEREIHFPDIAGYKTLVLDLHTHSVFSDGHVWPSIRVAEATRDGLDGIAITEHLEWQPHLLDIPNTDRNRAYEEAKLSAQKLDMLVIPGIEITRNDQVGHMNAVFVTDANELVRQRGSSEYLAEHEFDSEAQAKGFAKAASAGAFSSAHSIDKDGVTKWIPFADKATYLTLVAYQVAADQSAGEVLKLANEQGAFTFWNHPSFDSPKEKMYEFHKAQAKAGLLHGIEIANGSRYYENALRLALKHDLALIGTSDVHNLIDWDYAPTQGRHRPVTLTFATEKTNEAAREALFAKRTVVWWKNTLIGRPKEMAALLNASLQVTETSRVKDRVWVTLTNHSDANFQLRKLSDDTIIRHGPVLEAKANSTVTIEIHDNLKKPAQSLEFEVLNTLTAPNKSATVKFELN